MAHTLQAMGWSNGGQWIIGSNQLNHSRQDQIAMGRAAIRPDLVIDHEVSVRRTRLSRLFPATDVTDGSGGGWCIIEGMVPLECFRDEAPAIFRLFRGRENSILIAYPEILSLQCNRSSSNTQVSAGV